MKWGQRYVICVAPLPYSHANKAERNSHTRLGSLRPLPKTEQEWARPKTGMFWGRLRLNAPPHPLQCTRSIGTRGVVYPPIFNLASFILSNKQTTAYKLLSCVPIQHQTLSDSLVQNLMVSDTIHSWWTTEMFTTEPGIHNKMLR